MKIQIVYLITIVPICGIGVPPVIATLLVIVLLLTPASLYASRIAAYLFDSLELITSKVIYFLGTNNQRLLNNWESL